MQLVSYLGQNEMHLRVGKKDTRWTVMLMHNKMKKCFNNNYLDSHERQANQTMSVFLLYRKVNPEAPFLLET